MRSIPLPEFLYPCGVRGGTTTLTSGCRDGLARNRHDRFASNDGKIFLAFGVIASRGWSSALALV